MFRTQIASFTQQQRYAKAVKTASATTYTTYRLPTLRDTLKTSVLAASSATKADEKAAQRWKETDPKSKPVETGRKFWRPQVTSKYREPDCIPDPLGDLEILYKDYGKPIWVKKTSLPPRDDLIQFTKERHQAEFDRNIQWRECPQTYKEKIDPILKKYWDVFAEEGVRKHIRGVMFHVDTGEASPYA